MAKKYKPPFRKLIYKDESRYRYKDTTFEAYVPGINSGCYDKGLAVVLKRDSLLGLFFPKRKREVLSFTLNEPQLRQLKQQIDRILKMEYDPDWGAGSHRPPKK